MISPRCSLSMASIYFRVTARQRISLVPRSLADISSGALSRLLTLDVFSLRTGRDVRRRLNCDISVQAKLTSFIFAISMAIYSDVVHV